MDRREFLGSSAALVICANFEFASEDKFIVTVLRVDHPNSNKRIYPRAVIEKAITEIDGPLLGEFFDGTWSRPIPSQLDKASHEVTKIYLDGDYLMAEIKPLNTPQGRLLKNLLCDKAEFSFRPAGTASGCRVDLYGNCVIGRNYKFVSIDVMPTKIASKL